MVIVDVTSNQICGLQLQAYNLARNFLYGVQCENTLNCNSVVKNWARRLATANPDCDDSTRVLVWTSNPGTTYTEPGIVTSDCNTVITDVSDVLDCTTTTFTELL